MLVGRPDSLSSVPLGSRSDAATIGAILKAGKTGQTHTGVEGGALMRSDVVVLTPAPPRSPTGQAHRLAKALRGNLAQSTGLVIALEEAADVLPAACAVARAAPEFSRKTSTGPDRPVVTAAFYHPDLDESAVARATSVAESVRFAARLVDTPPEEMGPVALLEEAKKVAAEAAVSVQVTVIQGTDLRDQGFGGLWNVGRAAAACGRPPALCILSTPKAEKSVALVGKGVCYDTGGLAIKTPASNMKNMKTDMGGAAGVLGAFRHAVSGKASVPEGVQLHCVLCIVENSIGPDAYRNDDIIVPFSGKSVEVANTDAEGRLILADGLAYANQVLGANLILDMATLTGAQLTATGMNVAALVSDDEAFEHAVVAAGRRSGDLCHAMPWFPEFYEPEFASEVADMTNITKNAMNAGSACAGWFLRQHLVGWEKTGGRWLHIDMAGPSASDGRATGYGVALLAEFLSGCSSLLE